MLLSSYQSSMPLSAQFLFDLVKIVQNQSFVASSYPSRATPSKISFRGQPQLSLPTPQQKQTGVPNCYLPLPKHTVLFSPLVPWLMSSGEYLPPTSSYSHLLGFMETLPIPQVTTTLASAPTGSPWLSCHRTLSRLSIPEHFLRPLHSPTQQNVLSALHVPSIPMVTA